MTLTDIVVVFALGVLFVFALVWAQLAAYHRSSLLLRRLDRIAHAIEDLTAAYDEAHTQRPVLYDQDTAEA